ncbi:hypothetical protein HYW83_05745 [Candidatus Peregrinibacteria bacterium]|nr:hypothetical protein [Candidatus Peregrinibacteria bacterium]
MLQKAFENILRNWLTSFPIVLVIAILLTIGNGLMNLNEQAQTMLKNIEQKFSITVYLKEDADPFEVGKLITALEERADVVKPVVYTSKEAAWKLLSNSFSLDPTLLKKYQFSLPASLTITPIKPEDTEKIEAFIASQAKNLIKDPLATKDAQRNITRQMVDFIKQVKENSVQTLVLFIIIFIVGGGLLIASAIHLAITNRHREISIMKLVGASRKTIIFPFVMEGVILSITAFLIHLVFILPDKTLRPNFLIAEFVVVTVLGAVVSHLATLYHLKK